MRLTLRLAWRDAWRHRGKTLIALVMILLPVLAITAADVLFQTQRLDTAQKRDRSLGAVAAARVTVTEHPSAVTFQDPNPDYGNVGYGDPVKGDERADLRQILADRPMADVQQGGVRLRTREGITIATAYVLRVADPLVTGVFRLTSGRWPTAPGEVVLNAAAAALTGSETVGVRQPGGEVQLRVVGIAESASARTTPIVVSATGGLVLMSSDEFPRVDQVYVGGGPVGPELVRQLNGRGMLVVSRELIDHPAEAAYPAVPQPATDLQTPLAAAATVVAMVLLEVAFLAGPAFAVGARRQERSLALLAVAGGTPRQAGRVILAGAVIVGATAAVAGIVAGIGVAWLLRPVLQGQFDRWIGTFSVHLLDLAAVAGLGVLSAVAAALMPAVRIARTDVVRVLAGRRGDGRPSMRMPAVGVVLVAGAVGLAFFAAGGASSAAGVRTYAFGLSAIVSVVAVPFLVPLAVSLVARAGRWMPVPLRFAVRDAARHRARTVPAVAAVAATVAGAVALGIAVDSVDARGRASYTELMPMGSGFVGIQAASGSPDWADLTGRVRALLPGARITPIAAIGQVDVEVRPQGSLQTLVSGPAPFGQVADRLSGLAGLTGADELAADQVLEAGGVVLFGSDPGGRLSVKVNGRAGSVRAPAYRVRVANAHQSMVLSRALAARLRVPYAISGLFVDGTPISAAVQARVQQSLGAAVVPGYLNVERGYRPDQTGRVLQWILVLLASVLMVGGAATATVLSMADAEPDLATLSAVGAAGLTRRSIAAAYALVVGLVGSIAGALVGFIPGLAIAHPLSQGINAAGQVSYAIAVPWVLIGLLAVGLPVAVAGLIWVMSRTRLPMVARLT